MNRHGFTLMELTMVMSIMIGSMTVGVPALVDVMKSNAGSDNAAATIAALHREQVRSSRTEGASGRMRGYSLVREDGQWWVRPWYRDLQDVSGKVSLAPVQYLDVSGAAAVFGNARQWSLDNNGYARRNLGNDESPDLAGPIQICLEPGSGVVQVARVDDPRNLPFKTTDELLAQRPAGLDITFLGDHGQKGRILSLDAAGGAVIHR